MRTIGCDSRLCIGIAKLQRRLAPGESDLSPDWTPERPAGMRQRTYKRLVVRLARYQDAREDIFALRIAQFMRRWDARPEPMPR